MTTSLNKRYVDPSQLKSGRNESGLFDTIRRCYWDEEIKQDKIAKAQRNKNDHDARKKDETPAKRRTVAPKTYDFKDTWFPSYWLAFIMFGKPGKMQCLNSLSSGGLAKSSTDILLERMANKHRKREERAQQKLSAETPATGTPGKSRTFIHQYIVSKAEPKVTEESIDDEIFALNESILDLMGKIANDRDEARRLLLQEQLDLLQKRKTTRIDQRATLTRAEPTVQASEGGDASEPGIERLIASRSASY
jgi:hypothetical protein